MKTTRIAANNIGNKMLVQIADRGIAPAIELLEGRVSEVKKSLRGCNGGLKNLGWSVWLWKDAKEIVWA